MLHPFLRLFSLFVFWRFVVFGSCFWAWIALNLFCDSPVCLSGMMRIARLQLPDEEVIGAAAVHDIQKIPVSVFFVQAEEGRGDAGLLIAERSGKAFARSMSAPPMRPPFSPGTESRHSPRSVRIASIIA